MEICKMTRTCIWMALLTSFTVILAITVNDASAADTKNVTVITHPSVSDKSISKSDLKKIYLGTKIKWGNKKKIHFVTLKSGDGHKSLLKAYINKTPSQFKNYWKKRVFTGKGKMPKSFKSDKEMIAYVAKTPGAIGYISTASAADAKKVNNLKIK